MKNLRLFTLIILVTTIYSCARIGSPDGGPKDSIPPVMAIAKPMNKTVKFNKQKISIYFNEFIKFKNLNNQLIISPPMEKKPIIKPEVGVSKKISIEFLETLKTNTTYTINFGNSIVDNNEGNELGRFSYVFSTGNFLDSLSINGYIKDPLENTEVENISVLAYKNSHDTIVGNYTPNYLSNTLKSNFYSLENLSDAEYELIALEDKNNNYKYDKGFEKIGFLNKSINLKSTLDSINFVLFKETKPSKIFNPTQAKGNQLILGYQGDKAPLLKIDGIDKKEYLISKELDKDSLYIWFKNLPKDSISINVKLDTIKKTYTILPRELKKDTLLIQNITQNILHPNDSVTIKYNNPIHLINRDSILLFEKDSIPVNYDILNYPEKHYLVVKFDRKRETSYQLQIKETSFKDFLNNYNQKENIRFNTLNSEEYGEIVLNINNINQENLIIQLVNSKSKSTYTKYSNKSETIIFNNVIPNEYNLRIIKDLNKDKKYSTGNFKLKIQPEKVLNIKQNIKLRANSEIIENISID